MAALQLLRAGRVHLHDHRLAAGHHPRPGADRQSRRLAGRQHAAVRRRARDRRHLRDVPVVGVLAQRDRHLDRARRGLLQRRQGAAAGGRADRPGRCRAGTVSPALRNAALVGVLVLVAVLAVFVWVMVSPRAAAHVGRVTAAGRGVVPAADPPAPRARLGGGGRPAAGPDPGGHAHRLGPDARSASSATSSSTSCCSGSACRACGLVVGARHPARRLRARPAADLGGGHARRARAGRGRFGRAAGGDGRRPGAGRRAACCCSRSSPTSWRSRSACWPGRLLDADAGSEPGSQQTGAPPAQPDSGVEHRRRSGRVDRDAETPALPVPLPAEDPAEQRRRDAQEHLQRAHARRRRSPGWRARASPPAAGACCGRTSMRWVTSAARGVGRLPRREVDPPATAAARRLTGRARRQQPIPRHRRLEQHRGAGRAPRPARRSGAPRGDRGARSRRCAS